MVLIPLSVNSTRSPLLSKRALKSGAAFGLPPNIRCTGSDRAGQLVGSKPSPCTAIVLLVAFFGTRAITTTQTHRDLDASGSSGGVASLHARAPGWSAGAPSSDAEGCCLYSRSNEARLRNACAKTHSCC